MYDGFRAGVEPGGLTTEYEIKILICDLLKKLGRALPVSALVELFVGEGLGNYFEAASAAAALVKSGHILIVDAEGEKCYALTPLGESAAESFERSIPLSVREKAVEAAKRYFVMKRRRAQNHVEVRKAQDGYLLTMTITDVGSDLLTMTILLPDEESCGRIRDRFQEDPVLVYKGVVALLTGSIESVGALLDDPQ